MPRSWPPLCVSAAGSPPTRSTCCSRVAARSCWWGPISFWSRWARAGRARSSRPGIFAWAALVALKVIRKELSYDPEVVGRFYREFRVVGQLSHPHVVQAYDAGQGPGTHVLVMEYVEGIDLARLVKQHGPLPAGQAAEYIRQAASGLATSMKRAWSIATSSRRTCSGARPRTGGGSGQDSRPGPGTAAPAGDGRLDQPHDAEQPAMMGTPDYMAPEQAIDFHTADIRADIYSLGCTFYYLLTGQPPFAGGTLAEKLLRHQQQEPRPVTSPPRRRAGGT